MAYPGLAASPSYLVKTQMPSKALATISKDLPQHRLDLLNTCAGNDILLQKGSIAGDFLQMNTCVIKRSLTRFEAFDDRTIAGIFRL